MKHLLLILFLLPLVSMAQERGKLSPRTRIALSDYESARRGDTLSLRRLRAPHLDRLVNAYVRLDDEASLEELRHTGMSIGTVAAGIATVRLPISQINRLAALPCVRYLEIAPEARPMMDKARADVKADALHNASDGLKMPYKGEGVVVGIIDSGFEYGHVNFYNADRTQLRVKRVWNQSQTCGRPPKDFDYGTEYTTPGAILTALRDSTLSTHGTHVAGIAAGAMTADNGTSYAGIAPEADIVFVSLAEDEMGDSPTSLVVDAINYVYNYAASVGKPAVLNISLGTHIGPHDGTSAFDKMTDALQGPGRLLVGSVGNEGADRLHVSKTFTQNGEIPDTLRTFPDFIYPTYQFADLEIWGEAGKTLSVLPVIYQKSSEKVVSSRTPLTIGPDIEAGEQEYVFTQATDGIVGKVLAQSEINPDNGKPHLVLSMFFYDGGDLRPSVHLTTPDAQTVHMWSDDIYSVLTADGRAGYTEGNSDCSMGELGGTGNRIISVGAYTTRDHRFNYGIYYPSKFGEADDIASFSSHGPTVDGRLKPDIAAPGAYIISSFSSYFTGTKYRESPIIWNDKKYELGYNAGTSMASPLVAGVLATWLQARPDMTPEEVRAILSRTGRADKFAQDLPNQIWGYGKIDALSGIKEVLSMPAGIDEHVTAKRPHLLSLVNGLATAVLSTPATRAALNLYAPDGRLVKTIKAKYLERGESLTLETNGLQGGAYLLQLATNNETQTLKVLIY